MREVRCGRHKSGAVYKPRRLNRQRTRYRRKPIKQMHVQLYPLLFSNKDFRSFAGTRTHDNCQYFATLPPFHCLLPLYMCTDLFLHSSIIIVYRIIYSYKHVHKTIFIYLFSSVVGLLISFYYNYRIILHMQFMKTYFHLKLIKASKSENIIR